MVCACVYMCDGVWHGMVGSGGDGGVYVRVLKCGGGLCGGW